MNNYPKLINPKRLTPEKLTGTTTDLPGYQHIKASIGILNERDLVLTAAHVHPEEFAYNRDVMCHSVLSFSHDGGKTWGDGTHVHGHTSHETYMQCIDGVLFFVYVTVESSKCNNYIHRSEDGGKTWKTFLLDRTFLEYPDKLSHFRTTRNFVKMPDGSIVIFVIHTDPKLPQYRLRSTDMGKTWEKEELRWNGVPAVGVDTHWCEMFTYFTPSGRMMGISRIDPSAVLNKDIPYIYTTEQTWPNDEGMTMMLIESKDGGISWEAVRGLGYAAMMYPSVVYLNNHDFILTYTLRDSRCPGNPYPHMGVQAILCCENEDGSITADFDHDIIILDDRSPDHAVSVDGYGTTQMLSDGTLVTPFTYVTYNPELDEMMRDVASIPYEYYEQLSLRTGKGREYWTREVWDNMKTLNHATHVQNVAKQLRLMRSTASVIRWKLDITDLK